MNLEEQIEQYENFEKEYNFFIKNVDTTNLHTKKIIFFKERRIKNEIYKQLCDTQLKVLQRTYSQAAL